MTINMNTTNTSFSLAKLADDPDFSALFRQKKIEIKKTKEDLMASARQYQEKYTQEIDAGTARRALLLEDGKRRGLSEEEIFKGNEIFIPTKQTPLLNYLYFLLREGNATQQEISVLRENADLGRALDELKSEYDAKYGQEVHGDKENTTLPDAKQFVYGNVGNEEFALIKKLKTLSRSDNRNEAFIAYRKCIEVCDALGIDFDKVPINN